MKFLLMLFLILFLIQGVYGEVTGEVSVDLVDAGWIGIPGIIYDHNGGQIDSASDLAAYIDYHGMPVCMLAWNNPCTQQNRVYSKIVPGFWVGYDFSIYPGQGIEIQVDSNCTLILDVEYISNNHTICDNKYFDIIVDSSDEEIIIETVYISPSYEDVALLFYIFIIPILYLFVAFKKGISMVNLSAIFLVFAFFLILFQTIEISVNYIYLIIFLFLFILSIAGIIQQKKEA